MTVSFLFPNCLLVDDILIFTLISQLWFYIINMSSFPLQFCFRFLKFFPVVTKEKTLQFIIVNTLSVVTTFLNDESAYLHLL